MRIRKKDVDYTNIRIHIKTHEELDAIGKRGESMDDIVRKCLQAYRTNEGRIGIEGTAPAATETAIRGDIYEEDPESGMRRQLVAGATNSTNDLSSESKASTSGQYLGQTQYKQKYLDSTNIIITGPVNNEGHIRLLLPEIQFPTNKERLIEHAKKLGRYSELFILEELPKPNKIYTDVKGIEEDVTKLFTNNEKLIVAIKGYNIDKIVGCMIKNW